MIRALIFDFDGLILETESPIYQSWQELYQSYGKQLSLEQWETILGTNEGSFDPMVELEAQVGRLQDRENVLRQVRQREWDLISAQPVLPGVKDYLVEAKKLGLKVGLASSSPCDWVTGHLSRLGLIQYFDCIYARDDVRRTKPDPELYLTVIDEFQIGPEEAVVFEDSPNGILAAKRAGLLCVAVPNPLTRQLRLDHADFRLNSLAEMPLSELLFQLEKGRAGLETLDAVGS
jgi:beta-phosphoglucomutase-like phosphatase (HAD superfamily)